MENESRLLNKPSCTSGFTKSAAKERLRKGTRLVLPELLARDL